MKKKIFRHDYINERLYSIRIRWTACRTGDLACPWFESVLDRPKTVSDIRCGADYPRTDKITGLKTETRSIVCGKSNVVSASGSTRMEHRLNISHYGMFVVPTGANGQNGAHAVHHVTEEK